MSNEKGTVSTAVKLSEQNDVKKDTTTNNINASNSKNSENIVSDTWKAAGEPSKLSQKQILAASKKIDKHVTKNKKFPNFVTIAGYKFSMPEYMYLLSKTIVNKYNKKTNQITVKYNIKNPASPSGVNIKGKLTKKQYYTLARNVIKFTDKNKQAPNFVTSKLGRMQYQTVLFILNRAVYFSAIKSGNLPNSLTVNIAKNQNINMVLPKYTRSSSKTGTNVLPTTPSGSGLTLASIKDASVRVNTFVKQNNALPNYVEINGKQYSMPKFLYLTSTAIVNINKKSTANINDINVLVPEKPSGVSINGSLSKANYVDLASRVSNFIVTNKQAPNFASSPLGSIQYHTLISEFSKILEFERTNKKLPDSVTINVKSTDPLNNPRNTVGNSAGNTNTNSGNPTTILNDKYNGEILSSFLIATTNCQVTNPIIQTLAVDITKNSKTAKEKANAIFNWMKQNIGYNFYYNTAKGAIGTYNSRSGNCVDQTHLSIALYRAVGLPARYVSGTCTFTSGSTYGHVWAQVLVDNVWTVSDTTSTRNSLGVVNNWNPFTYTIKHGKIAEIFF